MPPWLRIAATAAYVVVLIVHGWHLIGNTRRGRVWHSGHLLATLAMIVMFMPATKMIVPAAAGEVVFVVSALVFGALAAVESVRRGWPGALWLISAIDLAAMAYMFAMTSTRLGWLTGLLATWFVLQSLVWTAGGLNRLDRGLDGPRVAGTADMEGQAPSAGRSLDTAVAITERSTVALVQHAAKHSLSVCGSLTVMSMGMAYMLVAMQLGMPQMDGRMPGM